ncbi:hypothetical protein [uncultured Gimesia sp.]|uniref:hypothetical protein n=1 Tax=uncultured Gimesia sp. TaxID=1678688 RepID=UPI00262C37DA|nr:hypothetical protein [uncultured Gimesia sp.]
MNEILQSKNNRSRNLMIVILLLFTAMTAARLNKLYSFVPDSADYVLMARGLVNNLNYRQIDFPGEPYFTVRPPGLSMLLTPAAIISPYNAIFAKLTVMLTAIMMLVLQYVLMRRLEHDENDLQPDRKSSIAWPILFVILLIATNPHIVFFSTIIMSEIPFMAFSLAIIYLISLDEERISKRNLILLTGLLMFLPLIRNVGIALILAIGIWSITKRKRWPYLISVFCSSATIILWMLRNHFLKSDFSTSSTITVIKSNGVGGTLLSMLNRSLNYFESVCQSIIPDTPGVIPTYERYLLDGNHVLPGPQLIYYSISIFVIAISVYGMLKCWERGGALSLLYISITFGILSLWPWIQPRYILPLIPIILAFLPIGFISLGKRLASKRRRTANIFAGIIILSGISLVYSQVKTDYSMIYANQQFISKDEEFYQTHFPSSHFSNFVEAGHWIKQHTSKNARILTSRPEVATTANRFQKQIYFEKTNPEKLHELIQSFKAKYLVSYDQIAGAVFPSHLLDNDLIYRLTPVYQKLGVIVIEIQPNYEGTIRHQYWQENESMDLARQKYEKFPHRLSSQIGYLKQLLAAEKYVESIEFVLARPEVSDVTLVTYLGWAYIGNRQYQEALEEFSRATRLPGQASFSQLIRRGGRLSQKKLANKNTPDQEDQSDHQLRLANEYWKLANFKKTHELTLKVLKSGKASQNEIEQARVLLARLHLLNGDKKKAADELDHIQSATNTEAMTLREMLNLENSLNSILTKSNVIQKENSLRLKPKPRASILKLVSIYESQEVPGKALKLLIQAHELAPDDGQILNLLAKYQLFYNLIPEAEASYLKLMETMPDDQNIKAALVKIEELKKVPHF